MLAVLEVAVADARERRVARTPLRKAVERRGEAGDPGHGHPPPGFTTRRASCERCQAVAGLGQVIERAHHQHGLRDAIGVRQRARVPDRERRDRLGQGRVEFARLADQALGGVNQVHLVAQAGQPRR